MLFSGIPEPYKPKNRFDVIRWDYFTETLIYLQDDFTNVKPLKGMCYCYSAASPREGVGERGGGVSSRGSGGHVVYVVSSVFFCLFLSVQYCESVLYSCFCEMCFAMVFFQRGYC